MNNSSLTNPISKKSLIVAALAISLGGTLTVLSTPVAAQSMTTSTCDGGGCMPPFTGAGGFGVMFDGRAWTSAIGDASAGRGQLPVVGKVDEEWAQAQSFKDSFASIGTEVRITGFQPGTSCEADCSSSQAVLTAVGNSMAGAMSQHYMRTIGVDGGPATASSTSFGGANTGFSAMVSATWLKQAPAPAPAP
jgi:hypothetical protein